MKEQVVVIGAAIMDLIGFPDKELIPYDSVPGKMVTTNGGVGRNIAENLLRLGVPTYFISAFGGDAFASHLQSSISNLGGNISHSLFLKQKNSALHLAIMDGKNDMAAGIAIMDIIQQITPEYLTTKKKQLTACSKIIVETNLPQNSLEWIANNIPKDKLAIDLVSIEMARKVKNIIGSFGTIKANNKEAAIFLGKNNLQENDAKKTANLLLSKGCEQVYITMGAKGVFTADKKQSYLIPAPAVKIASTTGAGDAFMAGITLGALEGASIKTCAAYGIAAAAITLASNETVSPKMTKKYLLKQFTN